ncbi:MAG: signal peptidase II [Alphaproteobacteria bacterium]
MPQPQQSATPPMTENPRLWYPVSALLGLAMALASFVLDQGPKYWMIEVYRIGERGRVALTSYFDVLLTWNHGISYGLLQQNTTWGRALLIGFACVAVVVMAVWMARSQSRLIAASIGFIIGGALGNITDRLLHGAVADFFLLHYNDHNWYIFNVADVAIGVGVVGVLLDWLILARRQ